MNAGWQGNAAAGDALVVLAGVGLAFQLAAEPELPEHAQLIAAMRADSDAESFAAMALQAVTTLAGMLQAVLRATDAAGVPARAVVEAIATGRLPDVITEEFRAVAGLIDEAITGGR